jgi:putative transposase
MHMASHLPAEKPRGRPRKHPIREVLDAIFYVVRGGCDWRMLPQDFPPWGTVYYWFRRWRLDGLWQRALVVLRRATRRMEGRDAEPLAAVMDSQSVGVADESGGTKGYDGGKNVPGRKRHVLVDISGLLLAARVTPADISDNRGAGLARRACPPDAEAGGRVGGQCIRGREPREVVRGTHRLATADRATQRRTHNVRGAPEAVVECSLAWICRNRRLAKDYECKVQTSECWMKVAMVRLMLKRLGINR